MCGLPCVHVLCGIDAMGHNVNVHPLLKKETFKNTDKLQ